ncbi:precorrin-2 dehydrogenase/sirohydrochlorin ferrochelatase family protein [Kyrpidia spormannii]|uniref:precorrin-2 dehydrogenase/sirohydrochlorin ferrochelatase family protein n=1 Tax=Kyrpidia spormannii TaxID=2055160 RepID=UPI0012FFEFFD|nr:bifunctional precorrin-2 dehydrogenase/sirohydrochlorin ferrochelatase [Kyrpidia spormannii]
MTGEKELRCDYLLALDLRGLPVLVVGGGAVGARKTEGLIQCGARVTVVSPKLAPQLERRVREGAVRWEPREYHVGEAGAYRLVFAAAGNPEVNRRVAEDARASGVWINVADRPELGNLRVPASFRRGPLTVAVSTAGGSPWLAQAFRKLLEEVIDPAYGPFVEQMVEARQRLRAAGVGVSERREAFAEIWRSQALDRWRSGDAPGAKAVVEAILGRWGAGDHGDSADRLAKKRSGHDPDPLGD